MEATNQFTEETPFTEEGAPTKWESKQDRPRKFDFIKRRRRHVLAALKYELARARADVPALASVEGATDAFFVLRRRSDDPEKIALTEAVLLAVKLGHRGLLDLATLGYLPTLEYTLGIEFDRVDDRDLAESMVLQAFAEAAADYRGLLANPCDYLLRETRRRFRQAARRYRRERAHVELADLPELERHRVGLWESKPDPSQASRGLLASYAESREEMVAILRSNVGDHIPREHLALVEATLLSGEDLPAFVDRVFPGLCEKDRTRMYERLKRQRSRTIQTLRELLAPWRAEVLGEAAHGTAAGPAAPVPGAELSPPPSPTMTVGVNAHQPGGGRRPVLRVVRDASAPTLAGRSS